MARYTGNRNRIARRFGVNIFGRARNPLLHKPNPPGMHGARRKKKSDYGLQLEEKQKLKAVYGMLSEKQLVNAYKKALRLEGNTAALLAEMLECRLDNVVFRAGFAKSRDMARQLVSHKSITVNGQSVNIPSYLVKTGDVVAVREKAKKQVRVQEAFKLADSIGLPGWVSVDGTKLEGVFKKSPDRDEFGSDINESLIVELYSR